MSKVAIVYWSGTGNTEAMAEAAADGARAAGADVDVITAGDFSAAKAGDYTGIAFGCPAMGAEVLEETEFQPMWDEVKGQLGGKKVALFGSWGWGNGAWMQEWEEDAESVGINLACESVICCDAPDDEVKGEMKELGAAVAQ
ncbi:MAG: flavodoxin domain-containing protein [Eubacteriales bacterium]|nr:flavodoxin domain-containing protein [Eubacteriales bacterium]